MRLSPALIATLALASAPVAAQVTRVTGFADHSGTIATANTSQAAIPQSTTGQRGYLMCQNPFNATTPLFIDFGRAASTTAGSIELGPGGSIQFIGLAVPLVPVNVASATAGARYICKTGFN